MKKITDLQLNTYIILPNNTIYTVMDKVICSEIHKRFNNDLKLLCIDDIVYTIKDINLTDSKFELTLNI